MNLTERIEAAINRITEGRAPMRIPADQTDPDLVLAACRDRIAELEGIKPELPPRPPELGGRDPGGDLPRYGLRWNGPQQPLAVPMNDGYWTPWHIAERFRAGLVGLMKYVDDAVIEAQRHGRHTGQPLNEFIRELAVEGPGPDLTPTLPSTSTEEPR